MKKLLLTCIMMLIGLSSFAQVSIGTGTDVGKYTPIEPYYGYSYSQQLYLQSEIGAAMNIGVLKFYATPSTTLANSNQWVVYLGHTAKTAFSSTTDWIASTSMTQSYAGTVSINGGIVTIILDTPFAYNGTDNLVVAVEENKPGYDLSTDDFYNSAVTGNRSIVYYNDTTNPDPVTPPTANAGPQAFVPNITFDVPPTCFPPSNLAVANITTTSANISWNAAFVAPGQGYQVYYSMTNTAPTAATVLDATNSVSSTTTTAALSALTSSSNYYYWVRSKCTATDTSDWVSGGKFSTLCTSFALPYTENFDSTTTGSSTNNNAPTCWSYLETSQSTGYGYVYNFNFNSAPNDFYLYNSDDVNGNIMLVSPPTTNLGSGNNRVRFMARTGTAGSTLEVGILSDTSDPSTFSAIPTTGIVTLTTSHAEYTVDLPAGPYTNVVFRHGLGGTYRSIYLDDITVENIPTCVKPSAVNVNAVTTTGGTVNWTAPTPVPGNGYQVYYSTTNTAPTASTVLDATNSVTSTTTSAPISGLTPATTYYVFVRAVCSATDSSIWTNTINFVTACTSFAVPYSQNFDTTATGTSVINNAPTCWSYLETSQSAGYGYVSASNANSAPNSYYLYNSSDVNGNIMLISPPTTNLGDGNKRVRFMAKAGGSGYTLEVGLLTDTSDPSTFVAIPTTGTLTLTTNYEEYIVDLPAAPYSNVVFRHGLGGSYRSIYLDDINVEAIPSCVAPTALVVTGATTSSLSLSWTAPIVPPADGYEVYYSTTNTAPTPTTVLDATNSVTSTTNTATISGLPANVVQYVWVRASCSATSKSIWRGPASANTGYCVPTGGSSSTTYYLNNITTTLGTTNIAYTASSYSAYVNNSTSTFSSYPGSTVNAALSSAGGSTYYYYTWVDWNNDLDFNDVGETIIATTTYTATASVAIAVPAMQALGNYRVRFASSYSGAITACGPAPYGNYVDYTLVVGTPPSCVAPTALMSTGVTTTTGTVSWTASGTAPANGYEVYYSTTNTAPTATTVLTATNSVTSTTTSATIPGLNAGTVYYVWVRSNCSTTDQSSWSTSTTFTTVCTAVNAPYTQDFSSATIPGLPVCGSVSNNGTGNAWKTIASATGYTGKLLNYTYNTTNAANSWFYNTGINMTAGTTYYIGYKYGNNSTTYTEKMKVAIGTANNAAAMTTTIANYTTINTNTPNTVINQTFTPTTSGVYYLGFQAYSDANQYELYLDDITVSTTATLGTSETGIKDNSLTIYPNPFTDFIRISDVKNVVSISIVDLSGRLVKTMKPATELNVGDLKTGMYLINLKMKDGSVQTVKAIKK